MRKIGYLVIILVGLFSVLATIESVKDKRARHIESFVSEWTDQGKPVTASRIKSAEVPVYTKITLIVKQDKEAAGFVTADIKDKLAKGQEIYLRDGGTVCGKVSKVSRDLDVNTGMYAVEAGFDNLDSPAGSMLPVLVLTGILKDVLVVPNSVIDISGDNYSLWKIEDGRAVKVSIKIGRRDGYGTVVKEGLGSGDLVVYTGQSILKEGDKVNIVEEKNTSADTGNGAGEE
ncbi:MAG: hypothetical protein PHW98_02850 [Candidatus Omnitrophica bacterium]|nr:hypothetical protein [Candidatus Omnitrophota bacterium]MDD5771682.1 hypothetical protein [Candidatus Omnitrophota bacterium]